MEKLTRRQHYVPRTYLKNFGHQRKQEVYAAVLPKESIDENAIFDSNIINICLEKDIYTLPGKTDKEKMLIETFYNENYETHYQKIYEILIDPSKNSLTATEHNLVISTVVTMLYRTKKWATGFNHFSDSIIEDAYLRCKQTNKEYFIYKEEKIYIKNKTLDELQIECREYNKSIKVLTLLNTALNLIDLRIINDGIMVSKLEHNADGFITSDNPVSISNNYTNQIAPFDTMNILKLPLDKNHLLHLMPFTGGINNKIIIRNNMKGILSQSQNIAENMQQYRNAERFLIGNTDSLNNFLKKISRVL